MSAAEPSRREWYGDGLRFSCTMCGNCCSGSAGYVWVTIEEGRAISRKLGIDEGTFYREYARKVDGRWTLLEKATEHGLDCIFLDRTTMPGKAICGVYRERPSQCRTWPFWPEIIRTPRTWESTKKHTPCPGMGQGTLVPLTQIRIQRDSSP